ncbi:unnamed protein product [Miscanthus lutarioriparius]|uniref:Uncharacterized protein n=1 Tax=Miscanthus lutarioriparius TaxID=422564 RepID=A0A811REU8_9POAL|nr:unnamed protein product [Miscanthus lutarioriparius]
MAKIETWSGHCRTSPEWETPRSGTDATSATLLELSLFPRPPPMAPKQPSAERRPGRKSLFLRSGAASSQRLPQGKTYLNSSTTKKPGITTANASDDSTGGQAKDIYIGHLNPRSQSSPTPKRPPERRWNGGDRRRKRLSFFSPFVSWVVDWTPAATKRA